MDIKKIIESAVLVLAVVAGIKLGQSFASKL
jgi:hypothetical protein